jgi:hypothetical protein
MVKDTLNDGNRLAELLASEITGHTESLEEIELYDVDSSAQPTATGAHGYRMSRTSDDVDDQSDHLATTVIYPSYIEVIFTTETSQIEREATKQGLTLDMTGECEITVRITNGAQVKWFLAVLQQL